MVGLHTLYLKRTIAVMMAWRGLMSDRLMQKHNVSDSDYSFPISALFMRHFIQAGGTIANMPMYGY